MKKLFIGMLLVLLLVPFAQAFGNVTTNAQSTQSVENSIIDGSRYIVAGRVNSTVAKLTKGDFGDGIYTYANVIVDEYYKSVGPQTPMLQVVTPGGKLGDKIHKCYVDPGGDMTLNTGDYVKLYISDRTIDSYSVVNRVEVIQSGGLIIDSLPYPPTVLEEYGCNFEYTGWRWNTNNFPLVWWQGRATSDCTSEFAAIGSAFTTWQSEPYSTVSFTMNSGVPTYTDTNHDDTQNVCLFNFFSGFIAACWSYHYGTGEIYGFDILFNDNYDWRTSTSSGNIFYVQEIATHEEGHVLDLNDLYYAGNSEQTMYGYSNYGETKKQSLNTGDTAGIQLIYPWDSQPSVAITSPLGGYAYDSPVSIVASVTCSDPITQCKFKITSVSDFSYDSGWITMTYSSGAWRGTWTTTRHGAHYITVRAITNSYVYGYDTHSFNVNMT